MGQRLNIEITKNGKVLANAYYHWSGFTDSAIELTTQILSRFEEVKKKVARQKSSNKDLLFAIRLLELTGAGIDFKDKESDRVLTIGNEFKTMIDRNEGIIGVTKKQIEETRNWEEARVEIDIATKIVWFGVFHGFEEDEKEEWIDKRDKISEDFDFPIYDLTFEQCFEMEKKIYEAVENNCYYFYDDALGCYLSMII